MAKGHLSKKLSPQGSLTNSKTIPSVALNFKVPPKFRRDFKVYAAKSGRTMTELLFEAYRALKERDRH